MSLRERVRQFRQAGIRPSAADHALARFWLPPALVPLFEAQHPRDIVHTAGTARWLIDRGHDDRDLVQAALLHDIAKGHQRRADRTLYVLAGAVGLAHAAANPGSGWEVRRAIARSLTHAEAGAATLEQAGASERVIALTRLHHSQPDGDAMLALLQAADAAS
jgi:hypothetical protein